jgi:hypothetical protein
MIALTISFDPATLVAGMLLGAFALFVAAIIFD